MTSPDAAARHRHRQLITRRDHVQAAITDLLRQVAHLGAHDTMHYDIRYRDPATSVLAAAQHADLIVVGTRSGGSHGSPLLLGTVSQDIFAVPCGTTRAVTSLTDRQVPTRPDRVRARGCGRC